MDGLTVRQQWVVVAVALAGILLVYGEGYRWINQTGPAWALVFIPLMIAAGLGGAGRGGGAMVAWAAGFVAAVAGFNLYVGEHNQLDRRTLARHLAFTDALYGTVRKIEAWDGDGQVWFWDGVERPNGREQRMVSFFFNWGQSTLGERFPGMVGGVVHDHTPLSARKNFGVRAGSRLLLFDPTAAEITAAQAALAQRDLKMQKLAEMPTLEGGAFKRMGMELWEAVPLEAMHGVAINLKSASTAPGVSHEGAALAYPARAGAAPWVLPLPEAAQPQAGPGVVRVRLGANDRRLTLQATDAQHQPLAETRVDPGTAVRDVWVTLKPGGHYAYLEVRPAEPNAGGRFTVERAEY
jgi:hypothetical protein